MARSVLVDAGFIVAFLNRRDSCHEWAEDHARQFPPPWKTCESALSEAFHLLAADGGPVLGELLRRKGLVVAFDLATEQEPVRRLMKRYANVPMALADACLVRMSEKLADVILLTTDSDFRIYRRHGRQSIPCVFPA